MKNSFFLTLSLAMCVSAPCLQAQEEQPAATPAATAEGRDAVSAAVDTYHMIEMYRTYLASAEMLENAAYDDDIVAGAKKLLEIAESMPTDGLPDSFKAYLAEKNARQRKSIEQITEVMGGRSEEEMTAKDLVALKKISAEAEAEQKAISLKYPEAEKAMGDAAVQAFTAKLSAELDLDEKAKQYLLEHPEVAAGGPEDAMAASMRKTAEEIRKHMESLNIKVD